MSFVRVVPVKFYLGTHQPAWLARVDVPLFVSRARLHRRVSTYPRALCGWALDSGGFSQVTQYGDWTIDARRYAGEVRRFHDEIGLMEWAAPQDWMCEPVALRATGLNVTEHIERTVTNFLELRSLEPGLPFVPVIQGFTVDDYRRCIDRYDLANVDLTDYPTVGIGSVCRRQGTSEAVGIVTGVLRHLPGMRLHGFGFKVLGLDLAHSALASSDSMAWSFAARRQPPMDGCAGHKNCANCLRYALDWRARLLDRKPRAVQPDMFC